MAGTVDVAPRVRIRGVVQRVENFRSKTRVDSDTGEVTGGEPAARVLLLTDGGGFAEVYVGPDDLRQVPEETPAEIDWMVDLSIFSRTGVSKAGQPYKIPNLSMRFVSVAEGKASSKPLVAAS